MQAADAATAAKRHGLQLEFFYAENNAVLQVQQLFRAIHRGPEERPTAIVVQTVPGEGLERVARAAVKAGVGWILISRKVPYLEELRREAPALPISTVGVDHLEVGRIQGRQFRTLMPKGGRVLYVQGPPDTSAAQERLQGLQSVSAGAPLTLSIVNGLWTEESGEAAVASYLRLKAGQVMPEIVGCQNDAMAVGAQRALTAFDPATLGRLPITGVDGLPEGGCRLVDRGQLAATVITPTGCGRAIDLLVDSLKRSRPMPPELLLPVASYPPEAELMALHPGGFKDRGSPRFG